MNAHVRRELKENMKHMIPSLKTMLFISLMWIHMNSLFCASPGLNVLPFLPLNGDSLFKPLITVLLPGNFI